MKNILISFFLILLFSCSPKIVHEELIGEYVLNENASEKIVLQGDSSYVYTFITKEGKVFTNTGKWEFKSFMNEIDFNDFLFYEDLISDFPFKGTWISRVKKKGTEIRLIYASEEGIYFWKK